MELRNANDSPISLLILQDQRRALLISHCRPVTWLFFPPGQLILMTRGTSSTRKTTSLRHLVSRWKKYGNNWKWATVERFRAHSSLQRVNEAFVQNVCGLIWTYVSTDKVTRFSFSCVNESIIQQMYAISPLKLTWITEILAFNWFFQKTDIKLTRCGLDTWCTWELLSFMIIFVSLSSKIAGYWTPKIWDNFMIGFY